MRIALSGATGFLGRHLIDRLCADGHSIALLSRRPVTGLPSAVETYLWNPPKVEAPPQAFDGADAIIHLAGATVNQRWTKDSKELLRSSRIDSTRSLVQSLSTLSRSPPLFLSASATGFYGDRGDEVLTESSSAGDNFLASLSVDWEKEATLARALGVKVQLLRTGVVLGLGGGALPSMLPVFRLGIGGKLGSGQQWMSWIHVEDWVGAVLRLLQEDLPSGPYNLTAPEPCRSEEFTRLLGKVLHRPAFLPVPEFALKLLFGEMSTVILGSQRVIPEALLKSGYEFRYRGLESGLRSLLQ
ncbi:MAG: TIGR01777 family oxidoreductase [Acidobacteria bacterium]|nr:TIGR01777 family oxidoreductase [Acidobacteriota bacterium]